jgi:NAD+ diphosphatase
MEKENINHKNKEKLILLYKGNVLLYKGNVLTHTDNVSAHTDNVSAHKGNAADTRPRFPYKDELDLNEAAEKETFTFGNDNEYTAMRLNTGLNPGDHYEWVGLRESYLLLPEHEYIMAAKGSELLHWASGMRYCGACGATMRRDGPISFRCEACGREVFPQLSPAVLVLVRKGDSALLVHARTFRRNFYGLVAGFVETGESLEECVRREVKEETSLEITNIRYCDSQSWPFPANLMIGFTADYAGGDLRFADNELSAGGFFNKENLPPLPTKPSLALQMIENFFNISQKSD